MTISFPHLADYHIPVETLLAKLFPSARVMAPPPITKHTLELGSRHSPDFVCAPFKYNLGNFIEALDNGADVLFQAGGGCRFGFYGDLQEQILKDLGYHFRFIKLFDADGVKLSKLHQTVKELGGNAGYIKLIQAFLLALKTVNFMDEIDFYVRERAGFQAVPGSFEKLVKSLHADLSSVRSLGDLSKVKKFYQKEIRAVKADVPADALRIGIVGELYDLMEPFANRFLERELIKNCVSVSRFINASYLLFQKKSLERETVAAAKPYLRYAIGADGTENVACASALGEAGYDGIIHVKPFGCTPEINAMPMLYNVRRDYKIPVLHFSFDAQNSETGVMTRLEAFIDMIKIRKAKEKKEC